MIHDDDGVLLLIGPAIVGAVALLTPIVGLLIALRIAKSSRNGSRSTRTR